MLPGPILKEARSWDPTVKTQVDEDNLKHMGVSQEELEGLQESPQRGTRIIGKPVFSCAGTGWEGVATGSGVMPLQEKTFISLEQRAPLDRILLLFYGDKVIQCYVSVIKYKAY